jgi:hypothetical protein
VLMCCVGSFISNILFNTYLMSHPTRGEKVTYSDYSALDDSSATPLVYWLV